MNEIKVGPIVYKIVPVTEPLRASDGRLCFAISEHVDCEVRMSTVIPETMLPITYWHEALHIMLLAAGRFEIAGDEGLIECLANGIVGVLKDNPGMRCNE